MSLNFFQVGLAYDSEGCVVGGALELIPWSKDTDKIRIWFENATTFLHGVCLSKVKDLGELGLQKERVRYRYDLKSGFVLVQP